MLQSGLKWKKEGLAFWQDMRYMVLFLWSGFVSLVTLPTLGKENVIRIEYFMMGTNEGWVVPDGRKTFSVGF